MVESEGINLPEKRIADVASNEDNEVAAEPLRSDPGRILTLVDDDGRAGCGRKRFMDCWRRAVKMAVRNNMLLGSIALLSLLTAAVTDALSFG